MKTNGDKIYDIRRQYNLTQEQLGKMIGVTRQTVSQWEANRRNLSEVYERRICDKFELDPDYFSCNEVEFTDLQLQNNEIAIVACAEAPAESKDIITENVIEQQPKKSRKSISTKALIGIIIAAAIVCIISLIAVKMNTKPKGAIDMVTGVAFNFSLENICWIIFSVMIIVVLSVGAKLIARKIKSNKQNKK
ncbi:MAG: helix-turn-helix domain-containing protein [Clostridia bacterium]|nr:helix-turn-helix domain-containing protein [Clostridia bacterium]